MWNVLLSDSLDLPDGSSIFSSLASPVGADLPDKHPARAAPGGGGGGAGATVVGPWQLVNHLPNASALTHTASMIRSLVRAGGGGGSSSSSSGDAARAGSAAAHVFDVVPVTYYIPPAGTPGGGLEAPVLAQFFRRLSSAGAGAGGEWVVAPAKRGRAGAPAAVTCFGASAVAAAAQSLRGDFCIQAAITRPLRIGGARVTVRLWTLVTDCADVYVWRKAWFHLSGAADSSVFGGGAAATAFPLEDLQTVLDATRGGLAAAAAARARLPPLLANALANDSPGGAPPSLESAIASATEAQLPPDALATLVIPRARRIIVDAVRGAFAAPVPPDVTAPAPVPGVGPSASPRAGARGRRSFEVFGVDFCVDADLRPWLLGFFENPVLRGLGDAHTLDAAAMAAEAVCLAVDPLYPAIPLNSPAALRPGVRPPTAAEILAAAARPVHSGLVAAPSTSTPAEGAIADALSSVLAEPTAPPQPTTMNTRFPTPGFDAAAYEARLAFVPTGPAALAAHAARTAAGTARFDLVFKCLGSSDCEDIHAVELARAALGAASAPSPASTRARNIASAADARLGEALAASSLPRARTLETVPACATLGPAPAVSPVETWCVDADSIPLGTTMAADVHPAPLPTLRPAEPTATTQPMPPAQSALDALSTLLKALASARGAPANSFASAATPPSSGATAVPPPQPPAHRPWGAPRPSASAAAADAKRREAAYAERDSVARTATRPPTATLATPASTLRGGATRTTPTPGKGFARPTEATRAYASAAAAGREAGARAGSPAARRTRPTTMMSAVRAPPQPQHVDLSEYDAKKRALAAIIAAAVGAAAAAPAPTHTLLPLPSHEAARVADILLHDRSAQDAAIAAAARAASHAAHDLAAHDAASAASLRASSHAVHDQLATDAAAAAAARANAHSMHDLAVQDAAAAAAARSVSHAAHDRIAHDAAAAAASRANAHSVHDHAAQDAAAAAAARSVSHAAHDRIARDAAAAAALRANAHSVHDHAAHDAAAAASARSLSHATHDQSAHDAASAAAARAKAHFSHDSASREAATAAAARTMSHAMHDKSAHDAANAAVARASAHVSHDLAAHDVASAPTAARASALDRASNDASTFAAARADVHAGYDSATRDAAAAASATSDERPSFNFARPTEPKPTHLSPGSPRSSLPPHLNSASRAISPFAPSTAPRFILSPQFTLREESSSGAARADSQTLHEWAPAHHSSLGAFETTRSSAPLSDSTSQYLASRGAGAADSYIAGLRGGDSSRAGRALASEGASFIAERSERTYFDRLTQAARAASRPAAFDARSLRPPSEPRPLVIEATPPLPKAPLPVDEIWVETRRPDGTPYYYNFRSRATTYVRPAGAQVFTHEEMQEKATRGELVMAE